MNGVITSESAAGVLNNYTSIMGDLLTSVPCMQDVLTFQLNVLSTGETLYSYESLNNDGINHVYSTAFSGDVVHGIPIGTYVGFEDLHGGGDLDYNDETFVFTNVVAAILEPETYAMLLAGLGLIGLIAERKRRCPLIHTEILFRTGAFGSRFLLCALNHSYSWICPLVS